MKKSLFSLAVAFMSFVALSTVQAQNAHFTDVVISDDGLTVTGKVAGLGNKSGSVEIVFTSEVTATLDCINPGGNVAPGQSETLNLSGGEGKYWPLLKNGSVIFSITLTLDAFSQTFGNPCPNDKWTAQTGASSSVKSLTFSTSRSGATGSYTFQ
jgi:hypothetical protein